MFSYIKPAFSLLNWGAKYIRNAILVIAVFVTIFQLFFYFMNKDKIVMAEDPVKQNREKLYEFLDDPAFKENDTGQIQLAVHRTMLCFTIGEACTDNPADGDENYENSLMGKVGSVLVSPYASPPASGVLWAYEGLQDAGFVPDTYAQGIGFYALQPLVPIWKVFRNIAYLFLVLIMVAIGFMIMFRKQLNPQTEIAITNVLPRIVMAMLLITFSFAIAGFLVDLMYVVMGLGGSIIIQQIDLIPTDGGDLAGVIGWNNDVFTAGAGMLFDGIFWDGRYWQTGGALLSIVPGALQWVLRSVVSGIAYAALAASWSPFRNIITGRVADGIPFAEGTLRTVLAFLIAGILVTALFTVLIPFILSLIIWITALFVFFRILFLLLSTYIKILLSIIFSPLVLLFEAFPGSSTFGFWFKGLFFNLMTFPIVAIIIMVAGLLAQLPNLSWIGPDSWIPVRTLWAPPFLYSVQEDGFVMLVAVSILFIIPDLVDFVKKSFNVQDLPFSITPGKLLEGAGVTIGGSMNLAMRSRSIAREFGWYHQSDAQGLRGLVNRFLPKDQFAELRKPGDTG